MTRSLGIIAVAACAAWAVGCANGDPTGDGIDASTADGGGGEELDASAADAMPDAGPTVGLCEECENNADCEETAQCVLTGAGRVCLQRCTPDMNECPDGFTCSGLETTYCAPTDGICCVDGDGDNYGQGIQCDGPDCDDGDEDINPGAGEVCNGIDDDCDPSTDDGEGDPMLGDDCDGGDADLCEEGVLVCDAGGLSCDDATGDNLDVCNGIDDDCNPSTLDGADEAQVGTPCDSTGDPDLCLDDEYVCDSSAGEVVCQDSIESKPDLCDGVDNDCDPTTEDGSGDPGVGVACDGGDADLCNEGTSFCDGGSIQCDDATGDAQDLCDGIDNDCDPSTVDGAHDPEVGAACDGTDSDLCNEGINVCSTGSLVCTDTSSGDLDVCDGIDNDCDPASADGDEDPMLGLLCDGLDSDLCPEGTFVCDGSGNLTCNDATGSDLDVCDGADNDCDPSSNDGDEDPMLGLPCDGSDGDLCPEGGQLCAGGNLFCGDVSNTNLELCNDIDDDCNAATPDGSDESWYGDACDGSDGDACFEGNFQCSGGDQVCDDNTGTIPEVCNNNDDDCDNQVDEDFDLSQDVDNCGSCGFQCTNGHGPTDCDGGDCDPTCVGLWGDCDNEPWDGCETPTNTLSNCGGCGVGCSLANASQSCGTGNCLVTDCNTGYCNLDGDHSTGCEHDLDTNPSCSSYTNLGSVSGDTSSPSVEWTGIDERWFRVYVSENDSGFCSDEDLCARITLDVPAGEDYDLYAYCDNCSGSDAGAAGGAGVNETVYVRWDEDTILGCPSGSDSGRYIYVEVRHWSVDTCVPYTLTVTGDVCGSSNTCGSK